MLKKTFLALLIIGAGFNFLNAQTVVTVKDLADSTTLVSAALRIYTHSDSLAFVANEEGQLVLDQTLIDTLDYKVFLSAEGYVSLQKSIKGSQLRNNLIMYLSVDAHHLSEVVITGQYKAQEATASMHQVKIIDAEKIAQMGAVNLRDALTNLNNVRLSQDNILGSSMSLQGIGGENVKILVDGVPLIGRQNGNLDLSQINLQNIERIEVIEGPLSVQYGTNALAGTINLITKQNTQHKPQAQLNTQYESVGNYNVGAALQGNYKQLLLSLNLGRNFFDGWNPDDQNFSYVAKALANEDRFQLWKPKEQYFAEGSISYKHKASTIAYKPSYFNEVILNRGMPIKPYEEKAFDDTYKTLRHNHVFTLGTAWKKYWNLNVTAAYSAYARTKHTYFNDLTTLEKKFSANASDHDTSTLSLLLSRGNLVYTKDSAKINYELGYDFNYETAFGKRIENKTQAMGDYAIYTTATYKLMKLTIKPGLRATYNTTYSSPLIPSLNLKYDFNKNHILRVSYARGFRAPSLKELYFFFVDINHNIIGNPQLRSEYSHNYALSYMYQSKIGKLSLKADISVFHNIIDNLITLAVVSGQQYSYGNIGNYKTQGIQTNMAWGLGSLKINTGLSYIGRFNQISEGYDAPSYNYSPEVSASVAYQFKKQHLVIASFYKYNGRMMSYQIVEEQLLQSFINPYQWLDASIQKGFWKQRLSITLGCKNIMNVTNLRASMAGTGGAHSAGGNTQAIAMGRNYFVKLNWKLFK